MIDIDMFLSGFQRSGASTDVATKERKQLAEGKLLT